MDKRFTAEWIEKQHLDEHGDWNPDDDEYVGQVYKTLEQAKLVAAKESKRAGIVEWCRVTVEEFNPDLGIPRRSDAAWDHISTWSGDWEGNWDEIRSGA
jgi:hypothetical protein